MLHFMISQVAELHELHERLSALRRDQLRAALDFEPASSETERDFFAEAEAIHDQVHAKYRGEQWRRVYPPPQEDEPDVEVAKILTASRETAMRTMMLLNAQLMSLPVIGDSRDREPRQ